MHRAMDRAEAPRWPTGITRSPARSLRSWSSVLTAHSRADSANLRAYCIFPALLVAVLCVSCGSRLELRQRRWARVVDYATAVNTLQPREIAVWDRFEDVSKHFASHEHMERVMNACARMALDLLATLTAMDPPQICKEAHELKQRYWLKASEAFVYQSREGADADAADKMVREAMELDAQYHSRMESVWSRLEAQ